MALFRRVLSAALPGLGTQQPQALRVFDRDRQKWLPSSRQAIEEGQDLAPERCAETTVELVRAACPAINGRSFGAGMNIQQAIADL